MPSMIPIGGVAIPYLKTVKYLGVTLDSKLFWSDHVSLKIKSATAHLLKATSCLGKLWGPTSKMTRWLYTGTVRPGLTYGCLVWGHICHKKLIAKRLLRDNRLTLFMMGNFRHSTPTAGLEVIAGVLPLEVHITQDQALAYLRTKSTVPLIGFHRRQAENRIQSLGQSELERSIWSHTGILRWRQNYTNPMVSMQCVLIWNDLL